MMVDQDRVLSEAAQCAAANGNEVGAALSAYVAAATQVETKHAEHRLRVALVTQSAGHEATSHDGATYRARIEHATAALEAWDGRKWGAPPPEQVTIPLGSVVVKCSKDLASKLGWTTYTGETVAHLDARGSEDRRIAALGQALHEGLVGDEAALRALAIITGQVEVWNSVQDRKDIAATEEKAAGMRLAAEREITKRNR